MSSFEEIGVGCCGICASLLIDCRGREKAVRTSSDGMTMGVINVIHNIPSYSLYMLQTNWGRGVNTKADKLIFGW
jgi:hypothetical protein